MSAKRTRNSFKKIISDLFELPKELVLDLPRMTMVGNVQFYLENHRGVIAYDQERVRIGVSNGELIIRGRELQIDNLLAEALHIQGIIAGLDYEV